MATIIKFLVIFIFLLFNKISVLADPIEGNLVTIQILDKITSRLEQQNIEVGKKIRFNSFEIEVFLCLKRPPEEIPEDFVLISVLDEIKDNEFEQVFKGWMISSSPSVTPFEHPIYDLWIKDCKIDTDSK